MGKPWTLVIDNTHDIDADSGYSIGTPESHTYKRAKCCQYALFHFVFQPTNNTNNNTFYVQESFGVKAVQSMFFNVKISQFHLTANSVTGVI